jgi:quinol monooxygenase YgiN
MLIYEVNLTVDGDIANRYSAWLREHIRAMLKLEGFRAAAWYVRGTGDTIPDGDEVADPRQWTIHYQVESREALAAYFEDHAERMRQEGADRFGDQASAERRVLEQQRLFSAHEPTSEAPV